MDDDSFVKELLKKLIEESAEAFIAKDREEVVKELADVQDIIDYLKTVFKISEEELSAQRKKKNLKNGAFDRRLYVESVSVEDGDEWLDYYLKNPEKYPEVKKPTE